MLKEYENVLYEYSGRILDLMQDGIFISDGAGISLGVNNAYKQLTGISNAEVRGKHVNKLVEDGIFDVVLNPRIVKSKKPASVVQKLGRNDKIVHLQGFPILNDANEVCLVVTFARDVTVMAKMREAIADQRRTIEEYEGRIADIVSSRQSGAEGKFASPSMLELVDTLMQVARTDATVLILGETGVGKDVLARMVHQGSPRRDKVFMKVNCGSISDTLIESELFGYVRGAFSGASNQGRAGYFEIASGGTIFLDEIGELPLPLQSKLLRVLEDHEIMRVGSSHVTRVDVRMVAATNRNLPAEIQAGNFREDLYYRLNVAQLKVPPLRERAEDITLLADHFLEMHSAKYKKYIQLDAEALRSLTTYKWPGNVRELYNTILQIVVTRPDGLLTLADMPQRIRESFGGAAALPSLLPGASGSLEEMMADLESQLIKEALKKYGSFRKTALALGVNRSTLFRKLKRAKTSRGVCRKESL